eukprot:gene57542-biopygen85325
MSIPAEGWLDDIDAWYAAVLPQVRTPPAWTRDIALSHFDFYTNNGSAWRNEVDWLARRLPPQERGRVVFAQEGCPFWVPGVNGAKGHWNCSRATHSCDGMGNPKIWAIRMTVDRVRDSLQYARSKGFRALLYFGDGLLVCKKAKMYDPARTLPDSIFPNMVTHMTDCTCAPDVKFCNSMQNPVHPDVFAWYVRYLKGLLRTFGDVIDGFVWDETFYITPQAAMVDAAGGYAATAMMRLVEQLTTIVYEYNPQMVFMTSDGIYHMTPYGVVASGQFPDFE